jgi:hypothetical protein
MHIHGNSFNMQAASLSAAQQLKAAETRRAADIRKKLLKSAAGLESVTDPEETLLIGEWLQDGQSHARDFADGEDEYHPSILDKDSDFH